MHQMLREQVARSLKCRCESICTTFAKERPSRGEVCGWAWKGSDGFILQRGGHDTWYDGVPRGREVYSILRDSQQTSVESKNFV